MKTALKVLFTKVERFFIKNDRTFVVRDGELSESSSDGEFTHEQTTNSPYLKKLMTETVLNRRAKGIRKEPTLFYSTLNESSFVKLKTKDGSNPASGPGHPTS